jgi:hypothetical protein
METWSKRERDRPGVSALEKLELVLDVFPLIRIGQSRDGLGNRRPTACQFNIQFDEWLLIGWNIFFGEDRVGRAFWNADRAIDAFIRIDREEIRPYAETIYRAHIYAVGVSAADAIFGNNMGHDSPIGKFFESILKPGRNLMAI